MRQDPGERSGYPNKTEPDLPASVRESPPEAEPGAPMAAALAAAGVSTEVLLGGGQHYLYHKAYILP